MTSRRESLGLLAALLAQAASAQPAAAQKRIAFLEAGSASSNRHFLDAFRKGLGDHGYEEGRDVVIDVRWADGRAERFPVLLEELQKLNPDVIVVASSLGAVAARKAVAVTPVVFVGVSDPVNLGIVTSLARPGGNMTGLSRVFGEGLLGKALQILRQIVPAVSRIAILFNPDGAVGPRIVEAKQAVQSLGLVALPVELRDGRGVDGAFAQMRDVRANALLVIADPLTLRHRDAIVKGAAASRIPAVYEFAEFARAGGLVSYSASVPALFERAAFYVDKILKGTHPAEIPIEQPTAFELVINMRAARALGLTVPPSLLQLANEVIQ